MALVRFSGHISSVRGRIGGSIFQESSAGPIVRARCAPVNRVTPRQVAARSIAASLQSSWIGLTQDQRNLWDGFVKYNPIHQQRNTRLFINGQQAFIKANHNRLQYGLTLLTDPQFNKCDHTPVDASLSLVAGDLTLTLDRPAVATEEFVILSVTIPLPATWNNSQGMEKILVFTTTNASVFNINTEYLALFFKQPVASDILFFKFTNADKRSGLFFPFKTKKVTL